MPLDKDNSWATSRTPSPAEEVSTKAVSQQDSKPASNLFKKINDLRKPEKQKGGEPIPACLYKENSWAASLALNKKFEYLTLSIICLNALWIGYDTDQNKYSSLCESAKDAPQWIIGENLFCLFFTFEVVVRFIAFRSKLDCRKDYWFIFDSLLVTLMVLETWLVPVIEAIYGCGGGGGMPSFNLLRMLRLARLTRMTRLMRAFPQMLTLVKGIVAALRSVGFTLLLLSILMYIFAIIFTSIYKNAKDPAPSDECEEPTDLKDLFGSMFTSLQTLFLSGTLLDELSTVMGALREDSTLFLCIFVVFLVLASFLVLNMMIGILFEVVQATKEGEEYKMKINLVSEVLSRKFSDIDTDNSGRISQKEFKEMCESKEVMSTLENELDIDPQQLIDMKKLLFSDEDNPEEPGLTFDDFLTLLVRHRPGEKAGPIDVQDFRKLIRMQEKVQLAKLGRMKSSVQGLMTYVEGMTKRLGELQKTAPGPEGGDAEESKRPKGTIPASQASPADAAPTSAEEELVANASDDMLLEELTRRLPHIDVASLVEV
jgi:voltage-gated sodium channel